MDEDKTEMDAAAAAVAAPVMSQTLSTWELVAARSRGHRLPQRAHGQKDFVPDGSDGQRERLQRCLDEHWKLLGEERVERLGNLVQAEWIADEEMVELRSKPGKFWQTMGHVVNGRQLLYPEEALYLLECGCIELRRQGLPLSVQEGHEAAFATEGLSLHQYQVYAHLKRLGYVVTRFRPESVSVSGEREPGEREPGERRKRKHSCDHHERTDSKRERCCDEPTGDRTRAPGASSSSSPAPCDEQTVASAAAVAAPPPCRGFGFLPAILPPSPPSRGSSGRDDAAGRRAGSGSGWDFTRVRFPNVAWDRRATLLPQLPERLVPPGTVGAGSDEARWAARINLHRDTKGGWRWEEHNPHRRWDVSRDPEARRCRDWADFKRLLEWRRGRAPRGQPHGRPREDPVAPLTNPATARTTAELLRAISIVMPAHILDDSSRLEKETEATEDDGRAVRFTISYDVFSADNTDFKKTRPGVPLARVCVCGFEEPVPDLRALKLLARRGGEQAVLVFGVVDAGEVSFFSFSDFKLPSDAIA